MPRSGSTLLQNILGNNPDIYSTPTSGIIELFIAAKKTYTESPTFRAQDEKQMKSAFLMFCRYGIEGYFAGLTDKSYAIDKSRVWAINYSFLDAFYPEPKIICMVRDLRDIIASMERNYRRYPEKWDAALDEKNPKGVTVNQRVDMWMNPQNRPVGFTLAQLKEAIHRGYDKNILFIRFEDLSASPDAEIKKIYKYLGIPYYKHDFNNIKQVTFEDDKFHGRYGDHKISPAIKPVPSRAKELLGEYVCDRLYELNKWYFDYFKYSR